MPRSDLAPTLLPAVWSLVRGTLEQEAPLARDELVARLTPTGLIDRAEGTTSRHVRRSLQTLEELGVVVGDASALALAQPGLGEPAFRLAVARALLRVSADADVWAVPDGGAAPVHHAQLGVAWLCLQGLESGLDGWGTAEPVLEAQFPNGRTLLTNGVPYDVLTRLVTWLGVAAGSAGGAGRPVLVPDPTPLLRSALDELIAPGERAPLRVVLDRAGELFPWLPHGAVGRAVAGRMDVVPDDAARDDMAPQCVSLALVRLELGGLLVLDPGDDTSERVALALPDETRPFASVVR